MQNYALNGLALCVVFWVGLVVAGNPILGYHYLADPAAVAVGDSVFYIVADTDYDNQGNYHMKAGYLLSSKDMKNWTDHGEIFRVPRDVPWASGVWAPAVAWFNNKMYVYFPNGANGVGVVSSSNPAGPYTDPLGKRIVGTGGLIGCDGIAWCFDPGVFVDDDGQVYLTWGGGNNTARPYGNNFSIVKLAGDGFTPTGSIIRMTGMNKSFEAPYITKYKGIYYLSYNAQGQTIDYATSNSPTGPWSYKGTVMANPNINGQNINAYNNNHHGFAEFKGRWYAAYHDRRVATAQNSSQPAYHRSVSIDLLEYNADGTFKPVVFTHSGPAQVGTFNPFDSIPAATNSAQKNITTRTVPVANAPNDNLLIPKPAQSGGSWVRLSGVNFGSGALTFKVNASSLNGNNKVEIRTGSATGTLAGTCDLANTGSWTSFRTAECNVTGLSGVVSEVYLKFTGQDSTAALKWWRFSSAPTVPPVPQGPYNTMAVIPGIIEAENYDVGGEGVAYHDDDPQNAGNRYRSDGVDIDANDGDGYAVGWTVVGEWLEYTVDVTEAGVLQWEARVASGADNGSFRLLLDGDDISGLVSAPNTGDWKAFVVVSGATPALSTGQKTLRLAIEDSFVNIDWIRFSPQSIPVAQLGFQKQVASDRSYSVYNVIGKYMGTVEWSQGTDKHSQVRLLTQRAGIYLLKSAKDSKVEILQLNEGP